MIENRTSVGKSAEDFIRLQDLWGMFFQKWYWFALSLFVALATASLYLLSTPNVYTRTAAILVKDDSKNNSSASAMNEFADMGIFKSNTNINNELLTLKSPTLMTEVVKRLGLNEIYTVRRGLKRIELYKSSPILVTYLFDDKKSVSFDIEVGAQNKFYLSNFIVAGEETGERLEGIIGDSIQTSAGTLAISLTSQYENSFTGSTIRYSKESADMMADSYTQKLRAELGNEDATIINLSIDDASVQKAEDILNTLIEVFEDLDAERCPRKYADALEEDLRWLGLVWDEGGSSGGPNGPYYQSECAAIYTESYNKLEAQGLVYPCFCSRAQLHAASAPHTSDGNVIYPGTCRGLTAEQIAEKSKKKAPAYRLMVPDEDITFTDGCMGPHTENLLRDCGDFYLRRADGVFAYQLAVVVDDARMGVTEVVRGADLLSSTARQLYLYRLLGLPAPKFAHCPLLLAPDGRRLSKRDGDQSLENLRAKYTAEEIVGRLAFAYGLQPEPAPRTPESLIPDFSWDKVPKQDICLPENLF